MKKGLLFAMFPVIMIFSSCNSYKQTSDYPNFSNVKHKKFGYQAHGRNKVPHQKRIDTVFSAEWIPSFADSLRTNECFRGAHSKEFSVKSKWQPVTRKSQYHTYNTNQEALTASISSEIFVTRYTFRPDTLKGFTPESDSGIKSNINTLPPNNTNVGNRSKVDQDSRNIFAILSILAVLLIAPALILAMPVLTFILTTAAIVFGALGLKSKRHALASVGMILGILAAFLLMIAFIIVITGSIF